MTKTKILGASLAIVFTISVLAAFQAIPTAQATDPPGIKNSNVAISSGKLNAVINTAGQIPTDGSAGAFGYAVLTSGLDNVLVMATHLCAADSPLQSDASSDICPDESVVGLLEALTGGALKDIEHDGADFHPHILDLKAPDGFCKKIGANLEVDLGSTVGTGNNVSPTNYQFTLGAQSIEVQAPLGGGDVNPDGSGVAVVSFDIAATAKKGVITDLCVLNVQG